MKIEQKNPKKSQKEFEKRFDDRDLNMEEIKKMEKTELNRAILKLKQVHYILFFLSLSVLLYIWVVFF